MIKINIEKCTGCKICSFVCPQKVIEINNNQKAEIKHYKNCMECGACSLNCEFDAINVTKGTGCLLAIVKEDILKIREKGTGCECDGDGEKINSSSSGGCC